jgi:hypothetical protein
MMFEKIVRTKGGSIKSSVVNEGKFYYVDAVLRVREQVLNFTTGNDSVGVRIHTFVLLPCSV